jgi:hypothetical protein
MPIQRRRVVASKSISERYHPGQRKNRKITGLPKTPKKKLWDIILTLKRQFDKNGTLSSEAHVLVLEDRLSVSFHRQTFRPPAGAALPTEFLERKQLL